MISSLKTYFLSAQDMREGCNAAYKTEYALMAAVIAQLATIVATTTNDTFTTTVSVSGYSQQDIQNVLQGLRSGGFTTSQSGTTLTIAW